MKLTAPARRKHPMSIQGGGEPLPRSPTVLLLIDFINPLDFPGAETLGPPAVRAADATARLKARLAAEGVQSVYANDNYGIWHSNFRDVWGHCRSLQGHAGGLARRLKPGPADLAILKPRHSAFFSTPLELVLGQLGAKKLVLVGLATDICVLFTAMDAHLRGFKLWVPADCVAAESAQATAESLRYMNRVLKADVRASAAMTTAT
ncbi:cysteine hydrolase family protein [Aquabacterium sp. J223]|uniref:cysteine hydrolase family protein n=1 Tax=Aquabacterium sp. J223 TaxID=2898431 RepID=UPI0021ADC41C|nr:isochorismatase family cysteine hydrolase [Aquabacterium sp. J223]UUX94263.1 cysteine hydrolase [Aquabacterium sp. J223]